MLQLRHSEHSRTWWKKIDYIVEREIRGQKQLKDRQDKQLPRQREQTKNRQDKQLPRQREQTLKTKQEQYRTIKKTWVNSCTPKG